MKILYFVISFLILCQTLALTQSCLPDGIAFSSQSEIDSFPINYPNCTEIEGMVNIYGDDITNLNGLNVLTSIGEGLIVGGGWSGNPNLTSLTGLDNLTSIGGILSIYYNNNIIDLSGLDNINADSIIGLLIINNASLSTCEVQSICEYLANPGGELDINNNASGCDNPEEVEEACLVSVEEVHNSEEIIIFPNPSSNYITIELPNTPQKNTFLTIYGLGSQEFITRQITDQKSVIDISGIPTGFYFVKVADERTVMVGKVVKK